jgi:formamidopyrimidine-DNA glycosylase
MPELPEVETVRRGLEKVLVGQTIRSGDILYKKSFFPAKGLTAKSLAGLKVKSVARQGKALVITLSKDLSLLIHLKMTGQLIYVSGSPMSERSASDSRMTGEGSHAELVSASNNQTLNHLSKNKLKSVQGDERGRLNLGHPSNDFVATMPSSHTRVIFNFAKGTLYFNDQRKFGWVKLLPSKLVAEDNFIQKLGIEPFDNRFTPDYLWSIIQRRPKSNIKAIISDQSLVAGLGNIYSDEALFFAGIVPTRLGKNVKRAEVTKLAGAMKKVLELGIKYNGTSLTHHRTPEGSTGDMQKFLMVYDRKGLPCKKCKTIIKKIRLNGRGTNYCPKCQK